MTRRSKYVAASLAGNPAIRRRLTRRRLKTAATTLFVVNVIGLAFFVLMVGSFAAAAVTEASSAGNYLFCAVMLLLCVFGAAVTIRNMRLYRRLRQRAAALGAAGS